VSGRFLLFRVFLDFSCFFSRWLCPRPTMLEGSPIIFFGFTCGRCSFCLVVRVRNCFPQLGLKPLPFFCPLRCFWVPAVGLVAGFQRVFFLLRTQDVADVYFSGDARFFSSRKAFLLRIWPSDGRFLVTFFGFSLRASLAIFFFCLVFVSGSSPLLGGKLSPPGQF